MPASGARRLLGGAWPLGIRPGGAGGAVIAPSRVLFGPHETNLARGRALGPGHADYYAQRAAGGTGVLVVETASVTDDDQPYEYAPRAADCGPGWALVADACRPFGTVVLAGLGHTGAQGATTWTRRPLSAPSAVADVVGRQMPAVLGDEEIQGVVHGFVDAAVLARRSGLHGVEIDAGARSLLRQFGSALTNHRDDAYGEDRWLLIEQIVQAVRDAVGSDGLVGLRLSGDELAPWGGIDATVSAAVAVRLAPSLDLLVLVRGGPNQPEAYRPDGHTPAGHGLALAAGVRTALRRAGSALPVVLQGGVVDPRQAQAALDDERCDAVEMTRAQIADPGLVRHVRAGHGERIRPCVRCNQTCLVRDVRNPVVHCINGPRDAPARTRGRAGGEVLVVGGGPAGLEAARVLAEAGRPVRLVEREAQLGGMLPRIARLPGRSGFGDLLRWWLRELVRLDVRLETGVGEVDTTGRDVILAIGSEPGARDYDVQPGGVVVEAADLLHPQPPPLPAGPVLVADPQGGALGVGLAELLAADGRLVVLSSPDAVVGARLASTGDLADANRRLAQAEVVRRPGSRVHTVGPGATALENVWTGAVDELPVAAVVDCGPRAARIGPEGLRGLRVGDCVAPRTIDEAVREGRAAALTLLTEPIASTTPAARLAHA